MLLADIKKLAKKRAKATNATGTPNKNVYGGVGMVGIPNNNNTNTTTPEPVGDTGGGDGGGE
jgi:hypothetical protein